MTTRGKRTGTERRTSAEKTRRGSKTKSTRKPAGASAEAETSGAETSGAPAQPPPGLTPVVARPRRSERAPIEDRMTEIDQVCVAWADIVAERMAADQTFTELVEQLGHASRDLRGLFLWDALQAAEAHLAMINDVLARHIVDRRADPLDIQRELRERRCRVAAVYAVNAFLAVLNQMKPEKPKWLALDDLDPRFAVLALAHQTIGYALEALRVESPPDVTEQILQATQDETVWVWRRMPEPGTETLAACAAAAAFFRALGAETLTTTDEVAALYAAHGQSRQPAH